MVVGSGGFEGKRLILLGQTGYMNTDITTGAALHLVPMPEANTYEYENRFFGTLGLLKTEKFPWDIMLAPPALMSIALALAFFLLALAFLPAATEPNLAALVVVVLFVVAIFCVGFVRRLISREIRRRRERSAC
jgi:peptidoglycan/LPS O-acetylase OafA/YrhL